MKLSLQLIFQFRLLIAIIALIVLGSFALIFNGLLIKNQNYLLKVSAIESSRFTMSNALSQFLAREGSILAILDIKDLTRVPSTNNINQQFQQGLQSLALIGKDNADISHTLQLIENSYNQFLKLDKDLLEVSKMSLTVRNQLYDKAKKIDNEVKEIRGLSDNISGRLVLMQSQNIKDMETNLRTAGLSNFKNILSHFDKVADARRISEKLSSDFSTLTAITHQMIQESDPDVLTNLKSNQVVQIIDVVSRELIQFGEGLRDFPDLLPAVNKIATQFHQIADQLIYTPQNIFDLRQHYNDQLIQTEQISHQIQGILTVITQQFYQLNLIAVQLRTGLIQSAEKIAQLNRVIVLSIVIIALMLMIVVGYYLQGIITNALNRLTSAMKKVADEEGNLSYRLEDTRFEDLNEVSRAFNTMTSKLQYIHEHLQELIDVKTKELNEASQKILTSARRAGMADVATSILHNIGNVLNSVNISVGLLQEYGNSANFKKLISVIEMIDAHLDNLVPYFTEDPKGQLLPKYLVTLVTSLQNEREQIKKEIQSLLGHVKHIQDIVAMQKSISGISGLAEKIFIPEVVDTAIQICCSSLENRHIEVEKDIKDSSFLVTDNSKLLQILVNLIQNSKDAIEQLLSENASDVDKKIKIVVEKDKEAKNLIIKVSDNGIGIAPENITKIFAFGFTTKKKGHGFGLHSSALTAKELGGSLFAQSEGAGLGATFVLTLPLSSHEGKFINVAE